MLLALVSDKRFSRFMKARRELAGFSSWEQFAEAASVGAASIYRVIADGTAEPTTHLNTRNALAKALGFADWVELVNASDSALSSDAIRLIERAAEAASVSPDELVERLLTNGERQTPPPKKPPAPGQPFRRAAKPKNPPPGTPKEGE